MGMHIAQSQIDIMCYQWKELEQKEDMIIICNVRSVVDKNTCLRMKWRQAVKKSSMQPFQLLSYTWLKASVS